MNGRVRASVWLAAMALLLSVGGAAELAHLRLPTCGADGDRTTVLMAQSAPEAALIPCMRTGLPPDWDLSDIEIDSAGSRLTLLADVTGPSPNRVDVVLADRCDTSDAVAVTTDEMGTRRLERIDVTPGGYTGTRHYTFAGGCVTYRFTASGDDWTRFVEQTARLWSFTTRGQVMRRLDAAGGPGGGTG